jgi:hypothetical protein
MNRWKHIVVLKRLQQDPKRATRGGEDSNSAANISLYNAKYFRGKRSKIEATTSN